MRSKTALKLLQGHDVYSPLALCLYDLMVLRLSNRFVWKCPTREILELYKRNVSGEHLDIGVGTGYYLSAARFPVADPQITLVDLNKNCLTRAAKRIRHFKPIQVVADILEDLPLEKKYSSASICYLLHCLPGGIKFKTRVFDRVANVLMEGGRIFGATIVLKNKQAGFFAHALSHFYNKTGIFSNEGDKVEDITLEFQKRFKDTHIEHIGCVVLFEGTVKQHDIVSTSLM